MIYYWNKKKILSQKYPVWKFRAARKHFFPNSILMCSHFAVLNSYTVLRLYGKKKMFIFDIINTIKRTISWKHPSWIAIAHEEHTLNIMSAYSIEFFRDSNAHMCVLYNKKNIDFVFHLYRINKQPSSSIYLYTFNDKCDNKIECWQYFFDFINSKVRLRCLSC